MVKKAKRRAGLKKKGLAKEKYLVIVESPAKSKTINKILGDEYVVMASMGHMVDLPSGRMGIDFDNDFAPEYAVIRGRNKYLSDMKAAAKSAKTVYLAADPDREGEAISWHIKNQIGKANGDIYRVRFEEITAGAIKRAFENSCDLDMNKVNAQQARRILDRIVGYSLSPLLWKKISRGLSAGRVQSVAVRLIVEREEEIKIFKPEEYWGIDVILEKKAVSREPGAAESHFKAKLIKHGGEKIQLKTGEETEKALSGIKGHAFIVKEITRKEKKSYPRAPYTTSVLQQDAFNKLNFSAQKTMRFAQRLYEGVELGEEGSVGLITYMRTDSVKISGDAVKAAKEFIQAKYGAGHYPDKAPVYKSRKGAQEAHEAIRPALPLRPPESLSRYLDADEMKLYTLIWKRFLSSQMSNAVFSVLSVNIDAGDYRFRAGGAELIFAGFLAVYGGVLAGEEEMARIPPLEKGEEVDLVEILPEQHFTKPPPRYSDATLIKVLEEKGIGRPSTYAPTIQTIVARNYVYRVGKYFKPTELGQLVNGLLVEHFPGIVDYAFTAKMESELDEIEEGKAAWVEVVRHFYSPFMQNMEAAKENMKRVNEEETRTDQICEQCGKPMIIKWGRRGKFLSCSDFPACRFAKSITTGVKCPFPDCDGELVERRSSRGVFYGCSRYPKCTHIAKTLKTLSEEEKGEETGADAVEDR